MELNAMDNQDISGSGERQGETPKNLRSFGGRRQLAEEQMDPEKGLNSLPEPILPRIRRPVSDVMRLEPTPPPDCYVQVPPFSQMPPPSCEHFPNLPTVVSHEPGFKAYILRKFTSFTKSNISIKERIRSLPVIGYVLASANAIVKIAATRHHHQLELANLREQNQMLRADILDIRQTFNHLELVFNGLQARSDEQFQLVNNYLQAELQKIASRFELSYYELRELHASIEEVFWCVYQGPNSLLTSLMSNVTARHNAVNEKIEATKLRLLEIERLQIDPRLRHLEKIDTGNRLMKLEQLEIAHKLKQLSHLVRLRQRDQHAEMQDVAMPQNLQQQVSQLAQRLQASSPASSAPPLPKQNPVQGSTHLDQFYIEFEDKFRGSKQEIKQRLRAYLPYVDAFARASDDQGRGFVDVGCGRGEWLELLGELGIPALGIDMNAAMVDACIASGCAAKVDDAIAYLQRQPAGSLAGVTGFHIIEHLPFEILIALFDAAYAALADGGILIFETPNPENLIVGSCNFYYDPTHRNPIVPAVAEFIATQRGFTKAEILRLHPFPESYRVKDEGFSGDIINQFFYGPQDYALIAWK
jgi:O-antigen chain-terminating methyltransferase